MSLQTGGRPCGAISTRSRSASWAGLGAGSVGTMPAGRLAALGRDLDEVEVACMGRLKGLVGRHDAGCLAVGVNESDLGNPDPVVDAQLGADMSSWVGTPGLTPRARDDTRASVPTHG